MLNATHVVANPPFPPRIDLYIHLVADGPTSPAGALVEGLLQLLARAIAPYVPPRKPGPFTLTVTANAPGDARTMKITATLPAKTAPDVATFELTYAVDAGPPLVLTSTGDPITFSAPVGAKVAATFVEIDAAGNRSVSSDVVTLDVADTIAPDKPGTFGLSVTGQD